MSRKGRIVQEWPLLLMEVPYCGALLPLCHRYSEHQDTQERGSLNVSFFFFNLRSLEFSFAFHFLICISFPSDVFYDVQYAWTNSPF